MQHKINVFYGAVTAGFEVILFLFSASLPPSIPCQELPPHVLFLSCPVFSRDEATLYERVTIRPSVRWSVRWSVTLSLFGLLLATNVVYTALFE